MSKRQSFSSYCKWLENQVALFHITRKTKPCRPLDIIKDTRYNLVPLHKRPDLLQECCKLLNSEWKRSTEARLQSLRTSCDKLPTCLLLLGGENELIGHCKISRVENNNDSVVIESLIIIHKHRSQGLGSMLLRSVEDYVRKHGFRNIYLLTKGQEIFYEKNGYTACEPITQLQGFSDYINDSFSINENDTKQNKKEIISAGPPPPPMPTHLRKPSLQINLSISSKTFMKKHLEPYN